MFSKITSVLLLLVLSFSTLAQESSWNVSNPGHTFKYKKHQFTTDEGTWMNLDVSPDGQHIVFDMLGDIYILPITGGKAKALRTGIAFEVQPRFSPDGKNIIYQRCGRWR